MSDGTSENLKVAVAKNVAHTRKRTEYGEHALQTDKKHSLLLPLRGMRMPERVHFMTRDRDWGESKKWGRPPDKDKENKNKH